MELSLTDTFDSKQDMLDKITSYATSIHFKFDIVESPRTLTFTCKGRKEFNCDASIVTCYKKKENKYVIKRMKMVHKCPIANNEFASTDDFLKNEIMTNISNYNNIRCGEIVNILYSRNIRVSYSSVFNIVKGFHDNELVYFNCECFNKDEIFKYFNCDTNKELQRRGFESGGGVNHLNIGNSNSISQGTNTFQDLNTSHGINTLQDLNTSQGINTLQSSTHQLFNNNNQPSNSITNNNNLNSTTYNHNKLSNSITNNNNQLTNINPTKFHELNNMINTFCSELKHLNPQIYTCFFGKMIFYKYPPYLEILYPILEIKYYKRKSGIVIYGVLYDPVFEPIIYSCLVSDDISDEASLKYFLYHTNFNKYLVEYDMFIINGCREAQVEFFVKTRDICKFVSNMNIQSNVLKKDFDKNDVNNGNINSGNSNINNINSGNGNITTNVGNINNNNINSGNTNNNKTTSNENTKTTENKYDNTTTNVDIQLVRMMWNYCNGGSLKEIDIYNSRITNSEIKNEDEKKNENVVNNENRLQRDNTNTFTGFTNEGKFKETIFNNDNTFKDSSYTDNTFNNNTFKGFTENKEFNTFNNYNFNRTVNTGEEKYNLKLDINKHSTGPLDAGAFKDGGSITKEGNSFYGDNKFSGNINMNNSMMNTYNINNSTGNSIYTNTTNISNSTTNIPNNTTNISNSTTNIPANKSPNNTTNITPNKKITINDLNKITKNLNLEEKNFIKPKFPFPLLNLNNLPECDLDFISYGVYELPVLECLNTIQKLSLDNLKIKKRFVKTDTKSLFGYNVTSKVERNMVTETKDCHKVSKWIGDSNKGSFGDSYAGTKDSEDSIRDSHGGTKDSKDFYDNSYIRTKDSKDIYEKSIKDSYDNAYKENLLNYTCTCNLYQILLIPCVHVCKVLGEHRIDPYLYVSNVYSKEQYNKLNEIVPVMNVNVKVQSDRFFIKKGPGRPKKNCNQEIVVD